MSVLTSLPFISLKFISSQGAGDTPVERVWHNRSHLEAMPRGASERSPGDKAGGGVRSRMSRSSSCLGWCAGNGEGHLEGCLSLRGENPCLWRLDVWGQKESLRESIVLLRVILRAV